MQSSEYGAMVAPSNLNVESGGFNVLVNFLGSSQYPFWRKMNLWNLLLFAN